MWTTLDCAIRLATIKWSVITEVSRLPFIALLAAFIGDWLLVHCSWIKECQVTSKRLQKVCNLLYRPLSAHHHPHATCRKQSNDFLHYSDVPEHLFICEHSLLKQRVMAGYRAEFRFILFLHPLQIDCLPTQYKKPTRYCPWISLPSDQQVSENHRSVVTFWCRSRSLNWTGAGSMKTLFPDFNNNQIAVLLAFCYTLCWGHFQWDSWGPRLKPHFWSLKANNNPLFIDWS